MSDILLSMKKSGSLIVLENSDTAGIRCADHMHSA